MSLTLAWLRNSATPKPTSTFLTDNYQCPPSSYYDILDTPSSSSFSVLFGYSASNLMLVHYVHPSISSFGIWHSKRIHPVLTLYYTPGSSSHCCLTQTVPNRAYHGMCNCTATLDHLSLCMPPCLDSDGLTHRFGWTCHYCLSLLLPLPDPKPPKSQCGAWGTPSWSFQPCSQVTHPHPDLCLNS